MDYSNMIYGFMENDLDKEAETELFRELYSNEELRKEFKHAALIEATMQKDSASLSPSVSAIEKTFSRLGFTYNAPAPPATEPSVPPAVPTAPRSFFAGAFGASLISSLFTAALTAVVFLFILNPNSEKTPQNRESAAFLSSASSIGEVHGSEGITANGAGNKVSYAQPASKYTESVQIGIDSSKNPNPIGILQNEDLKLPVEKIDSGALNCVDFSRPVYFVLLPGETKIKFVSSISELNVPQESQTKLRGFELQFNNFIKSYYYPKAKLKETMSPLLGNIGISARYALSDRFAIGIDLRNEFYYQEYDGVDGDKNFRYLQFPNLVSLSALGRYKWLEIEDFDSFIEMQLGGNKAGAAGRLSALIAYQPDPAYRFILGFEGSEFLYHHSDKYFWTTKYGILYGVAISF